MTCDLLSRGRNRRAAIWCLRLHEDDLSSDDEARLETWLDDRANAQAFDKALRVWNDAGTGAQTAKGQHLRALALADFHNKRRSHKFGWQTSNRRLGASIAAVLLLILISFAYKTVTPLETDHTETTERYETSPAEQKIVILDEGSKLMLDADSSVQVAFGRDRRKLTLMRGRARFDVAKDPQRPFTVSASGIKITATGTTFSVELLRHELHTVLFEGNVAVSSERLQRAISDDLLQPGDELVVPLRDGGRPVLRRVDLASSGSWVEGQISFDDEPLTTAVERMNRYSRRKIAVGDDPTSKLRVNGVFRAGDTQAFIEAVTALTPAQPVYADDMTTLRCGRCSHSRVVQGAEIPTSIGR